MSYHDYIDHLEDQADREEEEAERIASFERYADNVIVMARKVIETYDSTYHYEKIKEAVDALRDAIEKGVE